TGKMDGFTLTNASWITVNGFQVTRTTSYGINVTGGSHVTISANHVTFSGQPVQGQIAAGIRLSGVTSSLVSGNDSDHNSDYGIMVVGGSTGVEVRGNTTFSNSRVYERATAGIRIYQSPGNVVDRNITHDNQDSGIECYPGANNTLVYDNVSYDNGDHGIDNLTATGEVIVGNTVYGNVTAGINIEGGSTGATVADNISVDNGIGSPRTHSDIRVEQGSTAGTTMDYDLVHLTTPDTLLIWSSVSYKSLSAFQAASGQEAHGIDADPRWSAPGAGDFHLTAGSPAIDSADSGVVGEPATDVDGNPRVDDPGTADTGAGPSTYDDRGAYEFQGTTPDQPPSAALAVRPASGVAPLPVTADASASTAGGANPIASYSFDFGDGSAVVGPQSGASATHTYTQPGRYTVTVTVTDTGGSSSTATAVVDVAAPGAQEFVGNPGFETDLTGWNTSGSSSGVTLTRTSGGHTGNWSAQVSNSTTASVGTCLVNDSPNWVKTTAAGTYTASMWARADSPGSVVKLRFREYAGTTLVGTATSQLTLSSSWQQVTLAYTPSSPGSSTLDLNAYVSAAPPGTCFYADDMSVTLG
ncbi:MAG TPA: right-handed parallel beta-helix repeat-containing protein, partial [Gaiellales bacterium]|nr:right-handed parallel beta-helix repeat-containing protein [Gaiellales bacterium]